MINLIWWTAQNAVVDNHFMSGQVCSSECSVSTISSIRENELTETIVTIESEN